ncbi:unnamed protein product [Somion occarium]|uniref:ATP-dependent DNA helicase PIF1 n=2 Tax=Somion occarium TaxID=3059160 RepID=A0ABP1E5U3_9APHY
MSQQKQVMSGLRSIKRDFSSNPVPSSSQDSTPSSSQSGTRTLSGMEKRLRDIQAALDERAACTEKVLASYPSSQSGLSSSSSNSTLKRPATTHPEPANKRRQLPSSWNRDPPTAHTTQSRNTIGTVTPKTSSVPTKPGLVALSQEQTHILRLVEQGNSVFYTGSAGTGKSVLLREIIKTLKKRYSKVPDAIAVTASTGIAACNIGGVTIHSFAGIGLGIEDAEHLATKVKKNKKAMARWLRTKVLIIDEVSMVDGELFDKLARMGSFLRRHVEPFGGIQLVVTGDFFQLPPVNKGGQVKFAFEAEYWKQAIKNTFNLTQVFRQRDPEFVDMLNEMRFGRLTQKSIMKFKRLEREIDYEDGVSATELFPRREDVENSNRLRMSGIQGSHEHIYTASDGGVLYGTDQGTKMLANFMAPQQLKLKVGAQVMLIKNMDEFHVNGSMGTVVQFSDGTDWTAYPPPEEDGPKKPTSKGPAGNEKKPAGGMVWPVVEFLTSRRRILIQPEVWKVELPNGEIQVSRTQVPLILSWAMSIHKSQGQTLERVKVNLAKVFEKGQAYVALSRATSLEGLQVLHFDPAKVKAHPKVVEWSRTLQTISE